MLTNKPKEMHRCYRTWIAWRVPSHRTCVYPPVGSYDSAGEVQVDYHAWCGRNLLFCFDLRHPNSL